MRELTFALRTLRRSPIVTAVACLSLALGFGANTAVFSIFEQILQRPLPVASPEQLVNLASPGPKTGAIACDNTGDCDEVFSYPMFRDLERAPATPFLGLAAYRYVATNVVADARNANLTGMLVSGSYFPVLGLRPALGRLITDDDVDRGDPFVVVLGYSWWKAALGGDPAVIGRRITMGGHPVTVIGVAPSGFDGNTLAAHAAFYVPMSMRPFVGLGHNGLDDRRDYFAYLVGRLKPGVTIDGATAAINAVYKPIIRDVELPLQRTLTDRSREQFAARRVVLAPGALGQSTLRKQASAPIRLLLVLTALVVLIACANVANLLLVRADARQREIAIRLSVGASMSRIVRLLFTESLLLAVLSGMLGLAVAYGALAAAMRLLPSDLATSLHIGIDARVAGFVALVTLLTGTIFGVAPALHGARSDIRMMLGGSRSGSSRDTARLRSALVTLQVAFSMALLLAAGLFVKSLRHIGSIDLGIDPSRVVAFRVSPGQSGYDTARMRNVFVRLEDELRTLPATAGASGALAPLFAEENWNAPMLIAGYTPAPDEDMTTRFDRVGADYFSVLRMPLLAGRGFTDRDLGSPQVAVVNEAFVKRFALGANPVGRQVGLNALHTDITIVGVARDGRYGEVKTATPPMLYVPWRQGRPASSMVFFVRTLTSTEATAAAIHRVVRSVDPALPVQDLKALPEQIAENLFIDRSISILSALFAVLATLLACVGVYGILAQTVLQRTREIGVRIALGATAGRVRLLIMRQAFGAIAVGGIVGLALGLVVARSARALLFELEPTDPGIIAAAVVVVVLVTLIAGYVPARRAAVIHPMEALRHE